MFDLGGFRALNLSFVGEKPPYLRRFPEHAVELIERKGKRRLYVIVLSGEGSLRCVVDLYECKALFQTVGAAHGSTPGVCKRGWERRGRVEGVRSEVINYELIGASHALSAVSVSVR